MTEEWRPVVGWEGLYEVSSKGGVWSLRRGKPLKLYTSGRYIQVALCREGKPRTHYVHRLVCHAFHGKPPFEGAQVLHWDDDPKNNSPENLRWGSVSDNLYDAIRNGTYRNGGMAQTHCKRGHKLPEDRRCRACRAVRQGERRAEGLPEGDPRHGTLTAYTFWSCRCELCRGCQKDYDSRRNRSRRELRLRGD